MMAYDNIAVVVLAAGQGKRFGGDKLSAELDGQPIGLHAAQMLASMGFGWQFAICNRALSRQFVTFGFAPVINEDPEVGQSRSLHLAIESALKTDAEALLVCLADMPFVSADHIGALIAEWGRANGVIASTEGTMKMPPALFPRAYWPALLETKGDSGARHLLAKARLVSALPQSLIDIDTQEDLAAASAAL